MMTEVRSPTPPAPPRSGVAIAGAVTLAGLLGLAGGYLTLYAQGALPGASNSFANSGAVWSVIAFAAAALAACAPGAGRVAASLAGLFALVGEVIGYYGIAAPAQAVATTHSEQALWLVAALVLGPPLGLAAWYARRGTNDARVVSLLAVLGVVLGEGIYLVRRVPTAAAFGVGEIVIACLAALVLMAAGRVRAATWPAAMAVAAVVTGAVTAAYTTPFLL